MTPLFIGHEIYRHSSYGSRHPLAIPRVSSCIDLCRALGWLGADSFVESPRATVDQLARFHDPGYLSALMAAERDGRPARDYNIGINGNPIFPEVFRRPATAAGGTILAAERVAAGGLVYHPAGGTHHGRPDRASGFCYLNDPVLGLLRLLDLGVAPILYVDVDAHHGDGVQDAFHDDDRVFTVSIYEAGRWPHSGRLEDRAGGRARNLPVPAGFNDSEMDYLLEAALLPLAWQLAPEAVMIQCGADGLADDPLSRLALGNTALWRAVAAMARIAPRTIVLGGGGYNPWSVARCWTGIWATLAGHPVPSRLPAPAEAVLRDISWRHRMGRTPPDHWFTTLADPPRPGPVRADIRAVVRAVLADV